MWWVDVTTKISSRPAPTSWRTGCHSIGSFPTGSRCLFVISVSGLRREPTPPARMMPLTVAPNTNLFELVSSQYSQNAGGFQHFDFRSLSKIGDLSLAGYSREHCLGVKVVIPPARLVLQETGTERK